VIISRGSTVEERLKNTACQISIKEIVYTHIDRPAHYGEFAPSIRVNVQHRPKRKENASPRLPPP
jgi:hypothetical protein